MKRICPILLCLLLLLGALAGCGKDEETGNETSLLISGNSYGTGSRKFTFLTENLSGKQTSVKIYTNEETVGSALITLGILKGEDSPYGFYITEVNGIPLDYDTDGKYWAFYIDGKASDSAIDQEIIRNGSEYALLPQE